MNIDIFRFLLWISGLRDEYDQLQAAVTAARADDNDVAHAQALLDWREFQHRNPLIETWRKEALKTEALRRP